jgi:hypothetical protein
MEDQITTIQVLLSKSETFARTGVELIKLKAISKSADVVSAMAVKVILGSVLLLGFLFMSAGLALWIGYLTGESWIGFLSVGGFYLLCGLVLFLFRARWIKGVVRDRFIVSALN